MIASGTEQAFGHEGDEVAAKKPRRKVPQESAECGPELSPSQRIAIMALASGETQIDAAAAANVDRTTIQRWLKLPAFSAELDAEVEALIGEARRELRRHALTFARALVEVAQAGEGPHGTGRVQAAKEGLNRAGIVEVSEVRSAVEHSGRVDVGLDVRAALAEASDDALDSLISRLRPKA